MYDAHLEVLVATDRILARVRRAVGAPIEEGPR
jgi:hypothetical protein